MVFPVVLHFWILEEYALQRKELAKYEYFSNINILIFMFN